MSITSLSVVPQAKRVLRARVSSRGFSIPTAIFVIVILASLGAFLVTIGGSQQAGLAQDVVGTRAMQAARSGLEWGVHQTVLGGSAYRAACVGGTSVTLPPLDGMGGITVVVRCDSTAYNEGTSALRSYQIVATACNTAACPNAAPSGRYVERRLTALTVN